MIVHSIEIDRSPEEVFAYLDQLERHGEWQPQVKSARIITEGPVGVGTRCTELREVPGGPRYITYELTAHDPPRSSSFKGVDGPVRPVGTFSVEPAGTGSKVTVEFTLEGHGIGKLFAVFARMQARSEIAQTQQLLKERLEAGV